MKIPLEMTSTFFSKQVFSQISAGMNFIIKKNLKTVKIGKKCLTRILKLFPIEIGEAENLVQVRN